MFLSLLLSLLVIAALLPLVLPMLREASAVPERGRFDCAVYCDQLRELDRELSRGLIGETEAAEARLEIQRRLLAAGTAPPASVERWSGRSPVWASIVVMFVVGGTAGLYHWLGSPGGPGVVFVSRPVTAGEMASGGAATGRADLRRAAEHLAATLKADMSDAERWVQFARTTGSLRHWDAAVSAYRHALALGLTGPEVQVGLGEMLVMQAGGIVTPAARDALSATLKDDPKNPVARYYPALAASQAGEPEDAIGLLQSLLADISEDSPMRDEIGKRIGESAKAAGLPMPELAKGIPVAEPEPDADAMDAGGALPRSDQTAPITIIVDADPAGRRL
jgi:cytochrome c-type biogenesis protein CcmH